MTTNFKTVQAQNFSLNGSGAIAGATTVVLKSFAQIDGTLLTMTDFGVIGFGTIEPGNGTSEEQISFTGVVQNANGTATLTGVKSVLFISPYTATSGLSTTHPGSAIFVITNTSGFYDQFPAKANDETITGLWTFSQFPITPSNVPATTTTLGLVKMAVAPDDATSPYAVGSNQFVSYAVDAAGTDAYTINPTPAITAYAAGQIFTFKAGIANTGAATLAVSGLGAKTIKKNVSSDLATGDILLNETVLVQYDGTNMQLISPRIFDAATQLTGAVPVANLPLAAFKQEIPWLAANDDQRASGSNTDGSVFYSYCNNQLTRWSRDTTTGSYFPTHKIDPTITIPAGDMGSIIQIGTFIYMFSNDGTNIVCSRFLAADLTGEQVITVPVVACTTRVIAWTDGTFVYVASQTSSTIARKWQFTTATILTAVSTATIGATTFTDNDAASMWDGTTAYIIKAAAADIASGNSPTIYKLTNIDGSTSTATTYLQYVPSDAQSGGFIIPIDSTRIYVGTAYTVYDETGAIAQRIALIPIVKP